MPGYCQCNFDIVNVFFHFQLHDELKHIFRVDVLHGRSTDPADVMLEN